jgi:hypothetical protein
MVTTAAQGDTVMSTSAERLINMLVNNKYMAVRGNATSLANSIAELDRIDPTFSATAERLASTTAEGLITMWLDSARRINAAKMKVKKINYASGLEYNAVSYILGDIALCGSVERLNHEPAYIPAREAHRIMMESGLAPYPDLPYASTSDIDYYFHPLTVAAIILRAEEEGQQEHFVSKAPAFIAWAAKQPDMDAVLQTALRIGSTEGDTINSFMALQHETPTPMNSGVL